MSPSNPASTSGFGLRRENRSIDSSRELAELVAGLLAPRHADQLEALGERPLVGQVVERRQQLPVGEVAGGPEHHQDRRTNGKPLETLDERILNLELRCFDGGAHTISGAGRRSCS